MMTKLFFIFYMLYKSGLCLKEFGTLKNHTKSAKIMSKMKKLISHFSYLNFSREISRMEIPRFLVSHEELRRVLKKRDVYTLIITVENIASRLLNHSNRDVYTLIITGRPLGTPLRMTTV